MPASLRRSTLGLLVLVTGVASACAGSANALEGQAQAAQFQDVIGAGLPNATALASPVRLVRAGDEPRIQLSMASTAGATQRIAVSQGASLAFQVEDEEVTSEAPVLRSTIDLAMSGDGDQITVRATVAESAVDQAGTDPEANELASRLAARFHGSRTVSVDSTGRLVGPEPVLPDDEPGELVLLGLIDHRPLSLAGPLPSEPIGVGAEWTVTTAETVSGMPIETTTRYTATEVSDDEVRATIVRTVTVTPGNHVETQVLSGSQLSGTGDAVWVRGAAVGTVSYRLTGSLRYYLGPGDFLYQEIDRWVSTTGSVTLPEAEEDAPAEGEEGDAADPANGDPANGDPANGGEGDPGDGQGAETTTTTVGETSTTVAAADDQTPETTVATTTTVLDGG